MQQDDVLNDIFLLKDLNIKTLVSGDKQARVVLQTTKEDTVTQLKKLVDVVEVAVAIARVKGSTKDVVEW